MAELVQDTNPGEDSFVLLWVVVVVQAGMRELFENIILIFDYLALELFWYVLDAIEFMADEIIAFYYDFGYLLRDLVRFLLCRIV